ALGLLLVEAGGRTARLFSGQHPAYQRITSEFNSHLAVHRDQFVRTGLVFQAILHAQPLHLTYLSQIPAYQETGFLSRRLLRWQPELILNLPKGLGVLPFIVPGTDQLMQASVEALRTYNLIVWSKHGVMARSAESVLKGCDCIEYIETAARYELLNLQHGEAAPGLTPAEVAEIAATYHVKQDLF
ncbi:MAG: class II aldolase/adducin family protein, partial [Anaerolineales bacterium]|nr:class II aldolase/adducin family protein [Anaerolineales bacterium]